MDNTRYSTQLNLMAKEMNELCVRADTGRKSLKFRVQTDESYLLAAEATTNKTISRYDTLVQEHRKAVNASQEGLKFKRGLGIRKSAMQVILPRTKMDFENGY